MGVGISCIGKEGLTVSFLGPGLNPAEEGEVAFELEGVNLFLCLGVAWPPQQKCPVGPFWVP